ncbi:MAG: class II fructose-bisphosphate aldolase [Minisyncoccia bacterium]
MKTLRETVRNFRESGHALGHFNMSDSNQLKAIAAAAKESNLPVIVGLSEGERGFFPMAHARALVDQYQSDGIDLFLNADHTYSLEKAKAAIDAGVDSIVVDGAKLGVEQNIALVKSCVEYARASGRDVMVEGELGYIGQSSQVIDKIPEGAAITEELMTKPEDAKKFIEATGIDAFAPAVGNIHGIVTTGQPKLSISRIRELAQTLGIPMVLHGGSGSSDEEFSEAVKAGIAVIHINTDLRLIYKESIGKGIAELPHEAAPYRFLAPAVAAMTTFLKQKIRLFART